MTSSDSVLKALVDAYLCLGHRSKRIAGIGSLGISSDETEGNLVIDVAQEHPETVETLVDVHMIPINTHFIERYDRQTDATNRDRIYTYHEAVR